MDNSLSELTFLTIYNSVHHLFSAYILQDTFFLLNNDLQLNVETFFIQLFEQKH